MKKRTKVRHICPEPFMDQQHPLEEQPKEFLKVPEKNPLRMQSIAKNQPNAKNPEFDNQVFEERSERDLATIFCSQEKQIESLQETVSNLISYNKLLISRYYNRMNESVSLRSNALASNLELQNALHEKKAMAYAVNELQSQILQLKQPKISLTTPRSIIVNKLLNPPPSTTTDSHPSMPIPIQMAKDLKGSLDRAMSADEAIYIYTKFENWLGTEALQSVMLVTCCVCQKVRFRQAVGFSKPRPLNEFIERDLRLGCENPVCSACFLKSIFSSLARLRETWWKAQDLEICLPCPYGCSPAGVHINDRSSLLQVLQHLGNEKAEFSVIRIYDTILQLTQALYFVEPRLTSKARKVAARLHLKMMKNGLMHSPFDQRYRRPTRSVAGSPLNADFSHVELYNIDEGRKTLQVPIFTQLLRVEKTPIYCIICAESIYNISYDAVDEWIEVSIEFDGDWVWKISRFPKILRARCKHTIDFCTSCLQKHIGSQLEQLKLCSKSLWTPHPVATQSIQQR